MAGRGQARMLAAQARAGPPVAPRLPRARTWPHPPCFRVELPPL